MNKKTIGNVNNNIDDIDLDIFSNLLLQDSRYSSEENIRTNRNFSTYDFKELEACSLNKDKEQYNLTLLIKDLSFYFSYLPTLELERMVKTIFWLLKEGLKNYGNLHIPEFGKFSTYDRTHKLRYNVNTGKKYKIPHMKLMRVIEFTPSLYLKQLLTPRDGRHMRVSPTTIDAKEFPDLFSSFAREKRHMRQGQLLSQRAFDETFRFMGYTDAYISSIYNGDL